MTTVTIYPIDTLRLKNESGKEYNAMPGKPAKVEKDHARALVKAGLASSQTPVTSDPLLDDDGDDAERDAEILEAVRSLIPDDSPDQKPNVRDVEGIVGGRVTAAQRDAALATIKAEGDSE